MQYISKKQKVTHNSDSPLRLIWDANNWSCAYNSLFAICYNIWIQKPRIWTRRFESLNNAYLTMLTRGFKKVLHEEQSFEDIRDTIRHELHTSNPNVFPMGCVGTSVAAMATEMLRTNNTVNSSQLVCTQCDYKEPKSVIDLAILYMQTEIQVVLHLHGLDLSNRVMNLNVQRA
jgi:hypothetical protein